MDGSKRLHSVGTAQQLQFWEMDSSRNGANKMAEANMNSDSTTVSESTALPPKPAKAEKKASPTKAAAKKSKAAVKRPKSSSEKKPKAKVRRTFPQNTLEEALAVPSALKMNKGNPLAPNDIATALGYASKSSTAFFYVAASSRDYGLTTGSRDQATIELTDLGRRIVYPTSDEQLQIDKTAAFFNVPLFKSLYDYYGGGQLPKMEFVSSVLFNTFQLDESLHNEFCDLYQRNCNYLSLREGRGASTIRQTGDSGEQSVVVLQPGQYKQRAFIIMPFSEKGTNPRPTSFFDEVFTSLLTPACNKADFGVETARKHGSDVIHHTIVKELDEADLVIADLTDHNPNVLFELGIRIALDKPVLLIRAMGTPPIFDVDHMMRVFEYDPRLWKSTIDGDITGLSEHVKGGWENRDKNISYMRLLKTGQLPPR